MLSKIPRGSGARDRGLQPKRSSSIPRSKCTRQSRRGLRVLGDDNPPSRIFSRAIALDAKFATADLDRGRIFAGRSDSRGAITDLNFGDRVRTTSRFGLVTKRKIYRRVGQLDRAIADYISAKIDSRNFPTSLPTAARLCKSGRYLKRLPIRTSLL